MSRPELLIPRLRPFLLYVLPFGCLQPVQLSYQALLVRCAPVCPSACLFVYSPVCFSICVSFSFLYLQSVHLPDYSFVSLSRLLFVCLFAFCLYFAYVDVNYLSVSPSSRFKRLDEKHHELSSRLRRYALTILSIHLFIIYS